MPLLQQELGKQQQCVSRLRVVVTLAVQLTQLVQVADVHLLSVDVVVEVLGKEMGEGFRLWLKKKNN